MDEFGHLGAHEGRAAQYLVLVDDQSGPSGGVVAEQTRPGGRGQVGIDGPGVRPPLSSLGQGVSGRGDLG